ncbi:MAG: DUF4382 domain-containing protein [Deltaproteobacteria bacterium]|nr:DUF4382 domain-containing protein [Deltaproteobacteria bacterium]
MDLKKLFYLLGLGISVLSLTGLWACSSGGGTSSGGTGTTGAAGTGGASGTLTVNLTDSPFSNAKAVLVTFSEVQVHHSDRGWVTVPFAAGTSRTCDLKNLVGGAQDVLGAGSLPAGRYTQIRLVVNQSTLYFDNPSAGSACGSYILPPLGQNAPLEISSGEIKLNREFDLAAGGGSTILLDFDGEKSIQKTGNDRYLMNPVISIVSVQG